MIKRLEIWNMFIENWCIRCGEKTTMLPVKTDLPGIQEKICSVCNTGYMSNFNENADDLMRVPEWAILPIAIRHLRS